MSLVSFLAADYVFISRSFFSVVNSFGFSDLTGSGRV